MSGRAIAAVIVFTASALACSLRPPVQHKVSRSFAVHVKNDIGSVAGLKLKVYRLKIEELRDKVFTVQQQRTEDPHDFEEVLAESVTDGNGTAHFRLDRTGVFYLSPVSPPPVNLDWVELDVSDQPSPLEVELRWPSYAILRTSLLRGKLMRGLRSARSVPLKENPLRLHTPADYKQVAATTTDDDGAFEFRNIAPGLYIMEIVATNEKTKGNIAVYVAPDAPRDSLKIGTLYTSCGLYYDLLGENKGRYKPETCFKGGEPIECPW